MDREKRPTVAVPVREGGRLRFQFHADHVEISPATFVASVRIDKEVFRQVVAAADETWGRPLHPAILEDSTRIIVKDTCENCGAPFTVEPGSTLCVPHYPQSLGICLIGSAGIVSDRNRSHA